jgi:hypothetical protein
MPLVARPPSLSLAPRAPAGPACVWRRRREDQQQQQQQRRRSPTTAPLRAANSGGGRRAGGSKDNKDGANVAAAAAAAAAAAGAGAELAGLLLRATDKFLAERQQQRQQSALGSDGSDGVADQIAATASSSSAQPQFTATHALLLSLVGVWLLDAALGLGIGRALMLTSASSASSALTGPRWWAVWTDSSACASATLLARNLFFAYIFGRQVQSVEGGKGLWTVWLVGGAGGALAAVSAAAAASSSSARRAAVAALAGSGSVGALFALFLAATVLNRRKRWHWHRAFEVAALAPFVVAVLRGGGGFGVETAATAAVPLIPGLAAVRLDAVPLFGGAVGAVAALGLLAVGREVERRARKAAAAFAAADGADGGEAAAAAAPSSKQRASAVADSMLRLLTRLTNPSRYA